MHTFGINRTYGNTHRILKNWKITEPVLASKNHIWACAQFQYLNRTCELPWPNLLGTTKLMLSSGTLPEPVITQWSTSESTLRLILHTLLGARTEREIPSGDSNKPDDRRHFMHLANICMTKILIPKPWFFRFLFWNYLHTGTRVRKTLQNMHTHQL